MPNIFMASIDIFGDRLRSTPPPSKLPNHRENMHRDGFAVSVSRDTLTNEDLADKIQQEWLFKVERYPEKIVVRHGIVTVVLIFLEILLIVFKNVHYLGFGKLFTEISEQYCNDSRHNYIRRAAHLDTGSYHLWRGWVAPSFLAGSSYIVMSLISLRHELYHWKPELLEQYFETAKASKFAQYMPRNWLDVCFQIYKDRHQDYVAKHIQKRNHVALEDSKEFFKVLRVVAFNLLISVLGVLVLWILLLQTKIETCNTVRLPEFYVPPIQGILWYLCNDLFYFYPHWIAHTSPSTNPLYYRILPQQVAKALHECLKRSHKLHHRTKANLGVAAWYCSPWEQIFFNLIPVFIGPFLTQALADAAGVERIWGTHLVTLYIWLIAASAKSVLAHTGYRSRWNDPGKHDLHHERAFNPKTAVNFGTLGVFDWLHGTGSSIPEADANTWRAQRDRRAALCEASKRTGIALTKEQMQVVKQPDHSNEWVGKTI